MLILSGLALGEWVDLSQYTGTIEHLKDVCFVDTETGWAVGTNSTILVTEDGGNNWEDISLSTGETLTGVDFIDSNNGWICSSAGRIYDTTDGGESWSLRYEDSDASLIDISVYAGLDGWASGSYSTTDWSGGCVIRLSNTVPEWQLLNTPGFTVSTVYTYGGPLNAFKGNQYTHFGQYRIFRRVPSSDPGQRFEWDSVLTVKDSYIKEIDFCDNDTNLGWAAIHNGPYYTIDGGDSWQTIPSSPDACAIACFSFEYINVPALAWCVADYDNIYQTRQDDDSWEDWTQVEDFPGTARAICVGSSGDDYCVYIVGDNGKAVKFSPVQLCEGCETPCPTGVLSNLSIVEANGTHVTFRVSAEEPLEATALIYDVTGRLKASRDLGRVDGGTAVHTIILDPYSVPEGVYYCVVEAGSGSVSAQFVILD